MQVVEVDVHCQARVERDSEVIIPNISPVDAKDAQYSSKDLVQIQPLC